jgi:hypothetical protein
MSKLSFCAAAVLSTVMGLSAAMPSAAVPLPSPVVERATDVTQAATIVIRRGYYRGHRGYRYARPGFRRYNDGYWYPLAAFGPVVVVRPGRNWRWCGPRWNRHRCRY